MSVAPSSRRIVIGPVAAGPVAIAVTFPIADPQLELTVTRRRAGTDQILAFGTDWTWTPAIAPAVGGTATIVGGGLANDRFVALGDLTAQRAADIPLNDRYKSRSHNREYDRLWQSIQELDGETGRALKQDAFAGSTDPYDAGGRRITGLADGSAATDAFTKGQWDALADPLLAASSSATAAAAAAAISATQAQAAAVGISQITFQSRHQLGLANLPAAVRAVTVVSYYDPVVDGHFDAAAMCVWVRVASEPSHNGKQRSVDRFLPNGTINAANGGWWAPSPFSPPVKAFGARGDRARDDLADINLALASQAPNGKLTTDNAAYRVTGHVRLERAQSFDGPAPNGDVFGSASTPGAEIFYDGPMNGDVVRIGPDPDVAVQVDQSGGSFRNWQVNGNFKSRYGVRMAGVENFDLVNINSRNPNPASGAAACFGFVANVSYAGFRNTIRSCRLINLNGYAQGAAAVFYNYGNGSEGGITGCDADQWFAFYGAGNGSGNGCYIAGADSNNFGSYYGYRYPGGTGIGLYLDGDAPTGKNVLNNTWSYVRCEGGPIFATGRFSAGNKILAINQVDYLVTIIENNNAELRYDVLTGGYGVTPGIEMGPARIMRQKDGANTGVSTLLTLRHDLHADAAAPVAGIGVEMALETRVSGGAFRKGGAVKSVSTNVGAGTEAFDLVLGVMTGGNSVDRLWITPNEVRYENAANPLIRLRSSATGAGNFAYYQAETANSATVWQWGARNGRWFLGRASISDDFEIGTDGNIYLPGGRSIRINNQQVLAGRVAGRSAMTGPASGAAIDTSTATLGQVAQRLKFIDDVLATHGLH